MAEMHSFSEIQAYLENEGYVDPVINAVKPTVIVHIETSTDLTDVQKSYIRSNIPMYAQCDFCCCPD